MSCAHKHQYVTNTPDDPKHRKQFCADCGKRIGGPLPASIGRRNYPAIRRKARSSKQPKVDVQ